MQKIDQHSLIPFLLESLPELADAWLDFQNEWKDDAADLPQYLFLSQIADFIAQTEQKKKLEEVFESIEVVWIKGDHYSQEACTVGLLEDLQGTKKRGQKKGHFVNS